MRDDWVGHNVYPSRLHRSSWNELLEARHKMCLAFQSTHALLCADHNKSWECLTGVGQSPIDFPSGDQSGTCNE